jgi:mono/diheme cytochrome c family protein/glucose/arabinose dehydrogenase
VTTNSAPRSSSTPFAARAVFVLLTVAAVTVHGDQRSPADRPWPPDVQRVSEESPPLSPDQALKTFYMPPGYHLELVASEPLVEEPIAIDWDVDGRLWVVEMPGYMRDVAASGERDPIGRIVVLEDTDRDGRMDKRTVFADGLVLARSVKVLAHGVLVSEPPNLWLMHDTDGDFRVDTKELVFDRFGPRDGDPQNNANGFDWGLDNRLYTAGVTTVDLRLKHGLFEVRDTLQRGEWGVTHDDAGRTYRNTNESALHVDLVPTAYYARNPDLLRTRGSYERLATDENGLNVVWPVRPNRGTNRAYQAGIDRPDGTLAKFTAVCAPLVYRGDRLPADLYGNVFVAEPAANLVSRIVLDADDGIVRARKAYDRGEFLASTDERFRPVYLSNAPDGTLYVVDLYRGILEHRISLTQYLRDYILKRGLERPTGMGRIYRVVHETTRRDLATNVPADAPVERLAAMLRHPNGWWRDTAQRLLVERDDRGAVPVLTQLAARSRDVRTRLHAMWTLDALDAIEPATVVAALKDPSADIRQSAVRLAERWLGEPDREVETAALARLDDSDWGVRRQLAASLGALPRTERGSALGILLERYGSDPIVVDAALSGLHGSEAAVLERLARAGGPVSEQREPAIAMLAATIVRSARSTEIDRLLASIADDSRSARERGAILRGAEIALLGADMPGTPPAPPRDPSLPCATCPGGRLGPGGSYAFPRAAVTRPSAAPRLRLDREPVQFAALARDERVGKRVTALLERMTWPGKPGEAPAASPLTSDEQQRFAAGRVLYQNFCQACHQPDGRGREGMAPSLVGSPLALAAPEIPAFVLLNGKEGPIGLMPPIGAALDDREVASVLTYIRRAWEQSGSPVDPALVAAARARTAGRTRPWTNDELLTLAAVAKEQR